DSEVRLFAELIYSPTIINRDVAPHRPSQLCEALLENSGLLARDGIAILSKHHRADPPYPLALLRARRERPRCRAAEQRDEVAPVAHSITSSARASNCGGTVRPIARAVGRLMTSSILLGCTTGKSAGLAPLRMRPT